MIYNNWAYREIVFDWALNVTSADEGLLYEADDVFQTLRRWNHIEGNRQRTTFIDIT